MHQFFINPEQGEGSQVTLTGEEAKHLAKVLRLKPGEKIRVADGRGKAWLAELVLVEASQAVARLMEPLESTGEPWHRVILVQGLPKGDKLELIIQKATELGVTAIQPVATERAVVRLEPKKALERRERWQRVALEAVKQCHRVTIPEVKPLLSWDKFLQKMDPQGVLFLAWEGEGTLGLRQALENPSFEGPIYLAIGPEGGWAPEEVEKAKAAGAVTISLGSRILRTETAGLAALSMILYHFGDLG